MQKQPTIHDKINYKMAQLLVHYVITKHPRLKQIVPAYLKGKTRYNTCYDLPRPLIPVDQVNHYINESSEKVKTYLKHNLSNSNYLRVELASTPIGMRVSHGLVKELPSNYDEMERTGAVRFVETAQVRLK